MSAIEPLAYLASAIAVFAVCSLFARLIVHGGVKYPTDAPARLPLGRNLLLRPRQIGRNRLCYHSKGKDASALVWRDPSRIEAMLRRHALYRKPLTIYDSDRRALRARLCAVVSLGKTGWLALEIIEGSFGPGVSGVEDTVVVSDRGSRYRFHSTVLDRRCGRIRLALPKMIEQTGFRDSIRARVGPGVAQVRFGLGAVGKVTLRVLDIGARGITAETANRISGLSPGQAIPDLRIAIPGGHIAARGVFHGALRSPSTGTFLIGLELLEFADTLCRQRWDNFVFHQTHPDVRLESPDASRHSRVHTQASSYRSDLIPDDYFERLSTAYEKDWLTMVRENGSIPLLQGSDRSIGYVAGNLLVPKTWMVHHFGFDNARTVSQRGPFPESSCELYSAIIYLVQHLADADYLAIWVEENKRWNEMLFRDFVRSYSGKADSLLTRNTVYRFLTETCDFPAAAEDVEVTRANQTETIAFADQIARILPEIEVDALSYAPSEIGLTGYSTRGYGRTRTLYLARRKGKLAAGLITETGGGDTNVLGLPNCCRIIPLGDKALHPDIKRALLQTAIEHYRAAGRLQLIFFDDRAELDPVVTGLGFEPVSQGIRWIASRKVLPAWLSYVGEIFKNQSNPKNRPTHEQNDPYLYESRVA